MLQHFVLVGLLPAGAQAFAMAPISLGGLSGKAFVRAPSTFPSVGSISQQNMAIGDPSGMMPTNVIPHFTARPDKSIRWDAMDWCLDASGTNTRDVVRISHCTGAPAQKWNWVSVGRGLNKQIQLANTNKCIYFVSNHDDFIGEAAELRECGSTLANTWKFQEPFPHFVTGSSSLQHMILSFVAVATLGAIGLHALLRRWHTKPRIMLASQVDFTMKADNGGICLTAPLAMQERGSPLTQALHMSSQRVDPAVMTLSAMPRAVSKVPMGTMVPVQSLPAHRVKDLDQGVSTEFPMPGETQKGTGSLLGAISLVAGSAVGAGMLVLPAKTFDAGFAPGAATIILGWLFMSASGLLIAEVNINTLCATEKNAVSLDAMVEETLGKFSARVIGVSFTLLQFAVLSAYMSQGGNLLTGYLAPVLGPSATLPNYCGPLIFALVAGGAIYAGSEKQVENANNMLFGCMLATFGVLVALGVPQVDASLLVRTDMSAMVPAIPMVILSLVYHNIVPTVCQQLGCDISKIRTAIVVGSGIPALMFVLWNLVVIGSVSPQAAAAAAQSATGVFNPLDALGASSNSFGMLVPAFSLVAILTSFIGVVLGMVDYFADALTQPVAMSTSPHTADADGNNRATVSMVAISASRQTSLSRSFLFACTLVPPLAVALYDPSLFITILDNVGLYGDLVLFGIIPAVMAWQQRYCRGDDPYLDANSESSTPPMLPGGRLALSLMAGSAAAVVMFETFGRLSAIVG